MPALGGGQGCEALGAACTGRAVRGKQSGRGLPPVPGGLAI